MAEESKKLADAIWRYGSEHGFEDMASICARTLVGLAHASGGNEIEFSCDQGTVNVIPEVVPENQKH